MKTTTDALQAVTTKMALTLGLSIGLATCSVLVRPSPLSPPVFEGTVSVALPQR